MSLNLIDKITNRENLYWAWEKAKNFYNPGDVWFDEIELAGFEACLEDELDKIIQDIHSGQYKLMNIKPIGFPKSGSDEKGILKTRQSFWVSVRDQITWIAVINIIGPYFDQRMPFWSYGNRLYISVFYDENEEGYKSIRFGHYRNTSRHLLRKWNQSWPMFRKHIALTIKKMCNVSFDDKEIEENEINNQIKLKQLHCGYLDNDFWTNVDNKEIYWASIDFEKFYPSAKIKKVRENILKYLPEKEIDSLFTILIHSLTEFRVDSCGWDIDELEDSIQLKGEIFDNIPTGLFASHFLANILLFETDAIVHKRIVEKRNIAHFRFVDDHVILSHNFNDLIEWINWYKAELEKYGTGAKVNYSKTEPEALRNYLISMENSECPSDEDVRTAVSSCKLDPEYPSPLMTQTLNKISKINETDFNLLDDGDKERFISDLEHLLLAEFNDQEIRKDTRLSFAATVLTRLVPKIIIDNSEIIAAETQLASFSFDLAKKSNTKSLTKEREIQLLGKIKEFENKISFLKENQEKKYEILYRRTYKILLKVVYENFDKVRLWNRALEFCFNTGYNGLSELVDLISKLDKDRKASSLTLLFLESFILQVASGLVLKATKIITDKNSSESERGNSKLFLSYIDNEKQLHRLIKDNKKIYFAKAVNLFETAISVSRFTLSDISEMSFSDSIQKNENIKTGVVDKYSNFESSWIWWFNSKLCLDVFTPSKIWVTAVKDLKMDNISDISLASLYPKDINPTTFTNLVDKIDNEGWIYDLIKCNNKFSVQKLRLYNSTKVVLRKSKPKKGFLSLYEWNLALSNLELRLHKQFYQNNQGYYDTRLSEWTALEIVRQITQLLISRISERPMVLDSSMDAIQTDFIFKYIHPNNYIVPEVWLSDSEDSFSWQEWEKITANNNIGFNKSDKFIYDNRYSPLILDPYGEEDIESSLIMGLGALLTCLLSRDFSLPSYWNSFRYKLAWLSLIRSKLKSAHISSLTMQLLNSVFSKRNKETILLNLYFPIKEYEFSEDTAIDPPVVNTLIEFDRYIASSQHILKKYRLNIQDNLPRQLIPVSFKQLTKQFQPYNDEENNAN